MFFLRKPCIDMLILLNEEYIGLILKERGNKTNM